MSPTPLLRIGIVGATGIVGSEFLKILKERQFPVQSLRLFASEASKGHEIQFRGETYKVETLGEDCFKGLDLVFFSSGDPISAEWAPQAVKQGAFAIDNSNAFRMNPEVPLAVPEVNSEKIPKPGVPTLIANPNCSTIQLVVALNPLHKAFELQDVKVATYQSVSGAGIAGVEELRHQTLSQLNNKDVKPEVFPHTIAFNNIPQIGSFDEQGFCTEEQKMRRETRKILDLPDLRITTFTVRTPTLNSHCEAVWATFNNEVDKETLTRVLKNAPGIEVIDNPINSKYPLNSTADKKDPVYVGRIHTDPDDAKTALFWVVSDNIRKGAALNGIQIAEQIFDINQAK